MNLVPSVEVELTASDRKWEYCQLDQNGSQWYDGSGSSCIDFSLH